MAVFAGISCVRESRPGGGSNLLVSKQTGRCRRNGSRKESGQIRKGPSCRPPYNLVPRKKYSKSNRAVQEKLNVKAAGTSLDRLERGRVADHPIFQYLKGNIPNQTERCRKNLRSWQEEGAWRD